MTSYVVDVFTGFHICPQYNSKQGIDVRCEHPLRVGKNGFDKDATLEEIIEQIAMPNQAHIIVKKTPNSKWYVKNIGVEQALEIIRNRETNYFEEPLAKTYIVRF
jgi:hypothetical protein